MAHMPDSLNTLRSSQGLTAREGALGSPNGGGGVTFMASSECRRTSRECDSRELRTFSRP